MKKTKRFLALIMSVLMMLSMAMAVTAETTGGTITVTGDASEKTYTIYKMFDITVAAGGGYIYKITDEWKSFTATEYITIDSDGYVTWKKNTSEEADAAALAKLAAAYVTEGMTNEGSVKVGESKTVATDGFYLLKDSEGNTSGVLAVVGGETVTIAAKSSSGSGGAVGLPKVVKEVEEDSTSAWGKSNDADLGQTISFRTTITTNEGATNYTLHDTMASQLTFGSATGVVLKVKASGEEKALVLDTDYFVTEVSSGFEVSFSEELLESLKDYDEIVVSYTAALNSTADAFVDYTNETWLTHTSENVSTSHDSTKSKTYAVNVNKTGDGNAPLQGAVFALKKGDLYYSYSEQDGVSWVEDLNNATTQTSDASGNLTFKGVDADTYYLEETAAPGGYVKLTNNVKVEITNSTASTSVIGIQNTLGSALPETGGMGTTIFYGVGGVLVAAAVVLLITKKRMKSAE